MAADIEAVGAEYAEKAMDDVRRRARQAVQTIGGRIEIGMTEHDARQVAREVLRADGIQRGWHPVIVRIGANTVRGFLDREGAGVTLAEDDIFFVDIGPLVGPHEGDAGDTFVVGHNPDHHRARTDVHEIWHEVRAAWFHDGLTGRALYALAEQACQARGWQLNPKLRGHRLSDYPHKAHYGGPLAGVDTVPAPQRWVLELAMVHPTLPIGAFYEDTLLADQS